MNLNNYDKITKRKAEEKKNGKKEV